MPNKHTPGPWKTECYYVENGRIFYNVHTANGNRICRVGIEKGIEKWMDNIPYYVFEAYDKANATLIAAAPETAAERDILRDNIELFRGLAEKCVAERDSLRALNAELLAALTALIDRGITQKDWQRARTIIAKAKKDQP